MEKIAVLYICTGKYEVFWSNFYRESEKYFYPGHEKHYYVFTDSESIIRECNQNVTPYYQIKTGWPYDTLLRFQWFMCIQDKLRQYDFCYYFNANTTFKNNITEDKIPFPNEDQPIVLWCHPTCYNDFSGDLASPERNSNSTAYIPKGSPCRAFGGGFFGGKTDSFIEMCIELRDNIQKDLSRGIIAIWHDQSHLIKYGSCHAHMEVPNGIISEEEYVQDKGKICVVFINKEHFGGNNVLRGLSIKQRVKQWPKKIYSILLRAAKIFRLDGALRKIVHKK